MVVNIRPSASDDAEACDSILQIGCILGGSKVKWELHRNRSKMSLCW